MSTATRVVMVLVFTIGFAAKAVPGGKKEPDEAVAGKKPTPPVTVPPKPDPGDGTVTPFPIRTGKET